MIGQRDHKATWRYLCRSYNNLVSQYDRQYQRGGGAAHPMVALSGTSNLPSAGIIQQNQNE